VASELDGRSGADAYVVHNFYHPQAETGRMDGGLSLLLTAGAQAAWQVVAPIDSGLEVPGDGRGVATVDLNQDGWPDLVVAENDAPVRTFLHAGQGHPPQRIRLRGPSGNPSAVGSRVTMVARDGSRQSAEVYAGSGYLTQSPPVLYFAKPQRESASLRIAWPDGRETVHEIDTDDAGLLTIDP
jgi:hypothetical protein